MHVSAKRIDYSFSQSSHNKIRLMIGQSVGAQSSARRSPRPTIRLPKRFGIQPTGHEPLAFPYSRSLTRLLQIAPSVRSHRIPSSHHNRKKVAGQYAAKFPVRQHQGLTKGYPVITKISIYEMAMGQSHRYVPSNRPPSTNLVHHELEHSTTLPCISRNFAYNTPASFGGIIAGQPYHGKYFTCCRLAGEA